MLWRRAKVKVDPVLQERLAQLERCPYCAGYHPQVCPYLEEIEYYDSGHIRRILFRVEHGGLIRDIIYDDEP